MGSHTAVIEEGINRKRKDKIYSKLKELTKTLSDDQSLYPRIGFETDLLSRQLNIARNNVSKELNQLLREGKVAKILGKPVLYLDRVCLSKEFKIRIDNPVIVNYEEARQILMLGNKDKINITKGDVLQSPMGTPGQPAIRMREQMLQDAAVTENNDSVLDNIIGAKDSLRAQVEQAKAAIMYPPNGLHTLIVGATGVGKSTFAEAMYRYAIQSGRLSDGAPFVVFNCADYAENPQLLIAQLFGYSKGAFTGAEKEKKGLIDKANGGILFLDEVHRLPPEGQEMMFFLMDKGTYRRLGESENNRSAKVLIIAATTEDPNTHMLRTFLRRIPVEIRLPSIKELNLRERLSIIFSFFTEESQRVRAPVRVSGEVLQGFLLYECPGNIGQLKSDIQLVCARAFLDYMTWSCTLMEVRLSHIPWSIMEKFLNVNEKPEALTSNVNINDCEGVVFDGVLPNDSDRIMERLFEDDYRTGENFYDQIMTRWQEFSQEDLPDQAIRLKMTGQIESYFQGLFPKAGQKEYDNGNEIKLKTVSQWVLQAVREALADMGDEFKEIEDQSIVYGLALHVGTLLERLRFGMKIYHPYRSKIAEQHPEEYGAAVKLKERLEGKFNIKIPEDETGFLTMFLYAIKAGRNGRGIGVLVIAHGKSAASTMVDVADRLLGSSHASALDMPLDENLEGVLGKAVDEVKRLDMGKGVLILVDMGSLTSFSQIITQKTGILTKTVEMVSTPMVIEAVRKSMLPDMTLDMLEHQVKNVNAYLKPHDLSQMLTGENGEKFFPEYALVQILDNTLTFLDSKKACAVLECVLRNIFSELNHPIDREIITKFMFHCTCMIERLIRREALPYKRLDDIKQLHSGIYHMVKRQFELVEDTFGIIIPDTELAYIVDMLTIYFNTHLICV